MAQQKSYNRRKRGNNKGSRRKEDVAMRNRDTDKEIAKKPQNDPAWYSKFPQLVADTSNLFFSNPLGGRVWRADTTSAIINTGLSHVPGIITINTLAVPGFSKDLTSPINAVARGIYSFVRHANSGHSNYDAPDLMMYLLGMDTCYSVWAMCVRAYGVARLFNVRNRYLSMQWLKALGFDGDNIISNLAQFRALINTFAVKLASYAVPSNMDFYRRHTDMYTKVFLDEPSDKAQAYAFKLDKYYSLQTIGEHGSTLVTNVFSDNLTISDVKYVMGMVLDPIIEDEDMNIMSGDILKAFGDSGIFKVPMIPEEYVTPFVFDMTALSQIENSMATGTLKADSDIVDQDPATGALIFKPALANNTNRYYALRKILNLHHDNPTPMDIMESTRLMHNLYYDSTDNAVYIQGFGTEIVISYTMWTYISDGSLHKVLSMPFKFMDGNATVDDANVTSALTAMSNLTSFNYHPRMTLWINKNSVRTMVMDVFDLDNYTQLDDVVLENISNVAMLSLLDVGRIALSQG